MLNFGRKKYSKSPYAKIKLRYSIQAFSKFYINVIEINRFEKLKIQDKLWWAYITERNYSNRRWQRQISHQYSDFAHPQASLLKFNVTLHYINTMLYSRIRKLFPFDCCYFGRTVEAYWRKNDIIDVMNIVMTWKNEEIRSELNVIATK